jgi:cell division protein FtsB
MGQSNAERQAAWRERREQRIRELESVIAKLTAENNRLRQEKPHTKRGNHDLRTTGALATTTGRA